MIYVNGDDPLALDVDTSQDIAKSPNPNNSNCSAASSSSSTCKQKQTDAHKSLELFWSNALDDIKKIKTVDAKNQNLPLARIKKIMKLDENAKMIAAEAPLLFAKACEIFIQELTLRAWIHTEDNKRRTLQRSDIATAISRYDQFDFLIDIVPREDIKPRKESESTKSPAQPSEQVQYYLHLAQQHQQTIQNPTPNTATTIVNQTTIPVATSSGAVANVTVAAPQNILLTTATNPTAAAAATAVSTAGAAATTVQPTLVNNLQNPQQQIQILQQMITPTGEITHVPFTINANQLNLLRMQLQGNNANTSQVQQVIIPTIQTQQQPSIVQVNTGATGGIFLNTTQPTVAVSTASGINDANKQQNTGNSFRGNC